MRKLWFVMGLAFGFLLGSKAGPGPYQQLEAKARSVRSRPEVKEAVDTVKDTAKDQVDAVAHRVSQQVSEIGGDAEPATLRDASPQPARR